MVVGASADDAITVLRQTGGERLCVDDYLPLIFAELRLQCLMKTNRFRGDDVHEWAALHTRKNGGVDLLREFLFAHHDSTTRATQTLVRCSGYKLRVRNRTRMLTAGNQAGDVRHVDEKNRADRIGDLPQAWKINDARVSGCAGGNHHGPHFLRLFL